MGVKDSAHALQQPSYYFYMVNSSLILILGEVLTPPTFKSLPVIGNGTTVIPCSCIFVIFIRMFRAKFCQIYQNVCQTIQICTGTSLP